MQAISARQLKALAFVSRNPGAARAQVLAGPGATEADLAYLEQNDLVRGRELDQYLVSHLGEMVLRRSL